MEFIKLLVLFNIFVLKSWAMTRSELDEFSDFIEKTSQLDLNLKSNPDVDEDDDETVPENAWEESGKFEGDLILNERQRRLIIENVAEGLSRNGLKDSSKRWPDNEVIYYIQREHFSEDQLQAIQNGIDDIAQASCIKFRPYKKGDRDAVVIQGSRRGCFSQVGYQGGYQVLNLYGRHPVGRGCFRHGTVVHELLHTLGFYHMQSSPDRDDYIDVVWDNILQPARHNFRKYNTFSVSDFGVGYDYDSVLHYSKKAFSSNGEDTLVPKQTGVDIGQRIGLSEKDTQKLNKMYCDADSNNDDIRSHRPHRIPNKKKDKNKPFEGLGIGYHQGKTVVIKLPAVETYRLSVKPTSHIFDHFSKAPQDVSEAHIENNGRGKELVISKNNSTQISDDIPKWAIDENELPDIYNNSEISKEKLPSDISGPYDETGNVESKFDKEKVNLFEILNKEIKVHVYPPLQSDEFEHSNENNRHYDPSNEYLKKAVDDQPSSHLNIDKERSVYNQNSDNEHQYNFISHSPTKLFKYDIPSENIHENKAVKTVPLNPIQIDRSEYFASDRDLTLRRPSSTEKQNYFTQRIVPETISSKYYANDYKHVYSPLENIESIGQHKLLGEHAQFDENRRENDDLNRQIGNYKRRL